MIRMDRHFTARFYRISRLNNEPTLIAEAIERIETAPLAGRRHDTRSGLSMRMETVERRRGVIICDMCRIQGDDKPGNFRPHGIELLDVDELGHAFSFVYDPLTDVITIMHDERARIGALLDYLSAAGSIGPLAAHLIAVRANTADLEGARIKSLKVKLARADRVPDLFQSGSDIERDMRGLAATLEAPYIEINASIGRERGTLSVATVRRVVNDLLQGSAPVVELQVGVQGQDEMLDFLDQVLKYTDTVNMPGVDQHDSAVCAVRMSFIERAFEHHRDHIRSIHRAAVAA
jgi:hypothetical protein